MGCAVKTHKDTDKRGPWLSHTVYEWYLGTSSDHYWSHVIHAKGTNTDRISETIFFKHKYLTNPAVTHAYTVVDAERAPYGTLSKKKQGTHNNTMEYLKKVSESSLTTAENNKDTSWEEPAKNTHQ